MYHLEQKKGRKLKLNRKPTVGFKDMTSDLTKSITTPANNSNSTPSASKGKHHETGDRDSEGEDADDGE